MRVLLILLLAPIALFCGFGFLASFEYPGVTGWKVGYAVVGGLSLIGMILFATQGVVKSDD